MPKSFHRSFAGGIIAPELYGRIDLPKFQTGLRDAVNFITLSHGPAARRTGTYFINEAKSQELNPGVRIVPFVFSAEQAVIIELGHLYARFHTKDGTALEAAKSIVTISSANPCVVEITGHGYVNGDWVYCAATLSGYPLSGRFLKVASATTDTFVVQDLAGNNIDSTTFPAPGAFGITFARVYTLTTPFAAGSLFELDYAQNNDVLTLTSQTYGAYEMRRSGAASWSITAVSFTSTIAAPSTVTATATKPTPTNVYAQRYVVTTVAADGITESAPSAAASDTNNLSISGNYNTITWSSVTGALRYNVYKERAGVFGFIGQSDDGATGVVDDNIVADTAVTPPESSIVLNDATGRYPATVTYHELRRWFAGTANNPQTIYATRNGTESNLTTSVPSGPNDALAFRIAAQQQLAIRYLVPLSDMIALTVGGEFRIFADGGPAIDSTTLSIKPQGFSGAAAVKPVLTSGSALYVQSQGSRVRELAYDPNGTGYYRSNDVSILAPHLVSGFSIVEMAYARAPESVLWAVRNDGQLLAMTYVPDQQVYGWHRHTTDGLFESCAVIPEDSEDTLYVVVRRTINGRTVRYIERLHSRVMSEQADAFFLDSGLSLTSGPGVTSIGGLWHLEGKQVQVLADGAVGQSATVVNGTIALAELSFKVHIGLQFISDLTTLPLAYEQAPAAGQGMMKNVNLVHLRLVNSSVVKAGPSTSKLREYPARQVEDPYNSPPTLRTFEARLAIDPSWNTDGSVVVRQDLPLPLTVAAMALETATGG